MKILTTLKEKLPLSPQRLGGEDLLALLRTVMEKKKKIFHSAIVVPDIYEITLPGAEYEKLGLFLSALQQELNEFLPDLARRKGYSFLHEPPVVMIKDGRASIGSRSVVHARFSPSANEDDETTSNGKELPSAATVKDIQFSLHIEGRRIREPLILEGGSYLLGRGKDVSIQLNPTDQLISRRHCRLHVAQDTVKVEDLKSSNGTMLNGRRIISAVDLQPGDILQLGDTSIKVNW